MFFQQPMMSNLDDNEVFNWALNPSKVAGTSSQRSIQETFRGSSQGSSQGPRPGSSHGSAQRSTPEEPTSSLAAPSVWSVGGLVRRVTGTVTKKFTSPSEAQLRDQLRILLHTMDCLEKDKENRMREMNNLPHRHRRCYELYCQSRKDVLEQHIEKCTSVRCRRHACRELKGIHCHWKDCQSIDCLVCGPVMSEFAEKSSRYYAPIELRLCGADSILRGFEGNPFTDPDCIPRLREHLREVIFNAMLLRPDPTEMTDQRIEYITNYSEMVEKESFEKTDSLEAYIGMVVLKVDFHLKDARGLTEFTRPWQPRFAEKKRHAFIIRIFSQLHLLQRSKQDPEERILELLKNSMAVEEAHYQSSICDKDYAAKVNKCISFYKLTVQNMEEARGASTSAEEFKKQLSESMELMSLNQ